MVVEQLKLTIALADRGRCWDGSRVPFTVDRQVPGTSPTAM